MEMASTQDSLPPATMTSASPRRMKWAASPTACAPLAQAVTTAWLGPYTSAPPRQTPSLAVGVVGGWRRLLTRRPCTILTWPAAMLMRMRGTKKGERRRSF